MTLNPSMTVGQVFDRWPAAEEVAIKYGLDLCCGRGLTLERAAATAGLTVDELLEAIKPYTQA